MQILDTQEFGEMEQLLAGLLDGADPEEEAKVLTIHQRLRSIYEQQSLLRNSKARLQALRSQTSQ